MESSPDSEAPVLPLIEASPATVSSSPATVAPGPQSAPRAHGLMLVDKDRGPSSADVVRVVSRLAGKKTRVGHAGTLDPDATGLLVILVGSATRLSELVMSQSKTYEAVVRFGVETDSYDATGKVTVEKDASGLTREAVEAVLPRFVGTIKQRPPAFSAIKVQGKRAYELARSGLLTELPERDVVIHELRMTNFDLPEATFHVRCGKGMYLRTLAFDIGRAVGVGAHVRDLRRAAIGVFEPRVKTADLTPENWRSFLVDGAAVFAGRAVFQLTSRGALNLRRGLPIRATDFLLRPTEPVGDVTGVVDADGHLIAVVKIGYGGALLDRRIIQPL